MANDGECAPEPAQDEECAPEPTNDEGCAPEPANDEECAPEPANDEECAPVPMEDEEVCLPKTFAGRLCPKVEGNKGWLLWQHIVRSFVEIVAPNIMDRSRTKKEASGFVTSVCKP